MEWYQWEVNIQLLAKGATQLSLANDVVGKVKSLLKTNNNSKYRMSQKQQRMLKTFLTTMS
eukprot:576751-Ditylum_brightwellii.AAC.1